MSRFRVVMVEGYLSATGGWRTSESTRPGLSATVIDDATGREIVTYRTEDVRGWIPRGGGRRAIVIERARKRCAELERLHAA
jgi:hypothetical protein